MCKRGNTRVSFWGNWFKAPGFSSTHWILNLIMIVKSPLSASVAIQELFFCELKAPGFSSTQRTLNNHDKVNPTSLSDCDVQRKRKHFKNLVYLRKCDIKPTLWDLILTIDQWLCLLELHGTVPSQTAKHHAVCKNGRLVLILDNFSNSFYNNNQFK